jgi:N-acetylneuraminate synthase/N,N'-diacetyllegionaminate synthase
VRIGGRQVGPSSPAGPYVIAEIGVNHDGSADRAIALVEAAADSGADAVKLQVFEAERLMSAAARLAAYQARAGETDPVEMLRRLELPARALERIVERAHALGLHAIATVFSVELVDGAADLGFDAFKSASPDIVHRPLLEALAGTERPVIVSTGAATLEEVKRAAAWLSRISDRLAFLQCVSAYPTPEEHAAMGGIEALARATGLPIGYSDHCPGVGTGAMAVDAGACILEKHLTHDKSAPGPDHASSLSPREMGEYIALAKNPGGASRGPRGGVAAALRIEKRVLEIERDVRVASRQSIVTTRGLRAGERLGREDVTFKRPGTGIEPWRLDEVIGRTLGADVAPDMPIAPECLR